MLVYTYIKICFICLLYSKMLLSFLLRIREVSEFGCTGLIHVANGKLHRTLRLKSVDTPSLSQIGFRLKILQKKGDPQTKRSTLSRFFQTVTVTIHFISFQKYIVVRCTRTCIKNLEYPPHALTRPVVLAKPQLVS